MSYVARNPSMRWHRFLLFALFAAAPAMVLAQDEDGAADSEEERIDEIVVIGGQKPGDKVDLDALYEEEMRARLMRDLEVIKQEQAKGRWSKSEISLAETEPRIKWGYDPDAEARMRRETDFMGTQRETTQPASLFRVEF